MRIILVYPPIPAITTSTSPPVGLAYLAAVLLKAGADVQIISADAEGLDVNKTIAKILALGPDILGISISTPTVKTSLKIIENIRERNSKIKIMVGGPHPTLFPEEFLSMGVDFVVRGEGEQTLLDLYKHFNGTMPSTKIAGISYNKDGDLIHNPDRELIRDLDVLPFPSWDLFPVKGYKSDFRRKVFSLPVLSSRGCPVQCTFCYKGIFGNTFRTRSPNNIVDEIEHLKNQFQIGEFAIIDDSFTSNPKRAMAVCDLIVAQKINLPWTLPAGIRVSTVSRELLKKLKSAGCYRVGLGIESGNQSIINSIKKGIALEQIRKAVRLLREVGIESAGYFMIGNLEETEETINQTIKFAIELDPDYAQFTKATPYPGTAMYNQLKSENRIITDNWDYYDSFLNSRPVFRHKNLSAKEIDHKIKEAYQRFYWRPQYMIRRLKAIRSSREVVNLIKNGIKLLKNV